MVHLYQKQSKTIHFLHPVTLHLPPSGRGLVGLSPGKATAPGGGRGPVGGGAADSGAAGAAASGTFSESLKGSRWQWEVVILCVFFGSLGFRGFDPFCKSV